MSSDPEDFTSLTPAHFLIGDSLKALPEPNVLDVASNRLNRYKMLRQQHQQFWRGWSRDYLTTLQTRSKWTHSKGGPIKLGTLVLLKESTPPLTWRIGRVIDLHPGTDGVIRVASVKTSSGVVKRAVTQLCELLCVSCH